MPLEKGKQAIPENIKQEEAAGKPAKQAVAIALHTANDGSPYKQVGPDIVTTADMLSRCCALNSEAQGPIEE